MTQIVDEKVIHDEFIRLIKAHDYSYMYSEDNDVWARAKASMNGIITMLVSSYFKLGKSLLHDHN
jgi:hypothetical protein